MTSQTARYDDNNISELECGRVQKFTWLAILRMTVQERNLPFQNTLESVRRPEAVEL